MTRVTEGGHMVFTFDESLNKIYMLATSFMADVTKSSLL